MIEYLIDRVKAWWRGEKRIAPRGARGRVYTRTSRQGDLGAIQAQGRATASVVPSRIYRAAEDRWYKYNPETGAMTPEEGPSNGG